MVRRVGVIAGTLVLCAALAGCSQPATVGIFDRPQTTSDILPVGTSVEVDASTTRYVGADSAGDQYWVARPVGLSSSSVCVVYEAAHLDPAQWTVSCGGLPMSTTTTTGKTIEFEVAPVSLHAGDAEVIGNTLLVGNTALLLRETAVTSPLVSG